MKTPPPSESGITPIDEFDWDADVSPIDEQAAGWLVRLTSGQTTAEERAEFARWRDADPAHEVALSRLRAIWGAVPAAFDAPRQVPVATARLPHAQRRSRRGWALAASLLAAVALTYQAQTNWRHELTTAAGEQREITLPDGSSVLLSSGSAIDTEFSATTRGVSLARGEAYFEVKPDASRPFVLDAGDAQVKVVGTRFSVRRDIGSGDVTVAEGRVRVSSGAAEVLLEANQHVGFGREGLTATQAVNADDALAWRSGRLVIRGATLSDVAAQINRHRAGTIIVRVDSAQQRPINAVIDLDRVDDWLAALEQQGAGRIASLGPLTLVY